MKWHSLIFKLFLLLVALHSGFISLGQKEDKSRIRISVRDRESNKPVAFGNITLTQNDTIILREKTNFDGITQTTYDPLNFTDSILLTVSISPYEDHHEVFLPIEGKMIFFLIAMHEPGALLEQRLKEDELGLFVPGYIKIEGSGQRGFGLTAAFGFFGITGGSGFFSRGFDPLHGIGGCIGVEADWNNHDFLLGPKLTAEYHLINGFCGAKLSLLYISNFSEGALKLTPEIGLSVLGFGYLMVGYNFGLSQDNFSTINGWRLSLGANIPLLW